MANTEIVDLIIQQTADMLTYMLPVIGIMAGIIFMISWLMSITIGLGRRTFRG